jgi:hypothetical protein
MVSLSGPPYDASDTPIITVTGDYTFNVGNSDGWLRFDSPSAVTATLPASNFPLRTALTIEQKGAGQVTIVAGAGVTILSPASLKTNQVMMLVQLSSNEWVLCGDLAAS